MLLYCKTQHEKSVTWASE